MWKVFHHTHGGKIDVKHCQHTSPWILRSLTVAMVILICLGFWWPGLPGEKSFWTRSRQLSDAEHNQNDLNSIQGMVT
jgi:hypothetical protein